MTYKELIIQLLDTKNLDSEIAIRLPKKNDDDSDNLYDTIYDVIYDAKTNAFVIDKSVDELIDTMIANAGCDNEEYSECTLTPDAKFDDVEKELMTDTKFVNTEDDTEDDTEDE